MSLLTSDDLARHRWYTWALLALLCAVTAWFWSLGKGSAGWGTLFAALGCLGLILPPRERMPVLPERIRRLPRWADALPLAGTILTSPGYGLGWFYGINPFDEFVHLVNGCFAGAVFAALLLADGRPRRLGQVVGTTFSLGFALSVGWEAFEWAAGLIGDWRDTSSDIVITTAGAMLGAATVSILSARPPAREAHPAE